MLLYGHSRIFIEGKYFQSAVTWEYKTTLEKHASQKDYVVGFGGKYGVQDDRKDKAAVGWEYKESLAKHESQKGASLNQELAHMKKNHTKILPLVCY